MKLTIRAVSSSGGSYPVEFSDESGALRVFCHCQAGVLQQMCKHKVALLKGDRKVLFEPTEKDLLDQVLGSKAYIALKPKIEAYEQVVVGLEEKMTELKELMRTIKSDFAFELTFGRKRNQRGDAAL